MSEATNIQKLKRSLGKAVEADDIDFDAVLRLSAELAKHDPDNVRFTVDAAHINRLGLELVSKQETAVAELVKNAYDADATKVRLTFVDAEQEGGILRIEDDGEGMTRDQIIEGFMRLSTADKLNNPFSQLYRRRRAGRKGIGRFAAQRLGRKLTLISQPRGTTTRYRVEINWNAFTSGLPLDAIANRIRQSDASTVNRDGKDGYPHGTTLVIRGLRDSWTDARIERVFRYVSELLQPFPIKKVSGSRKSDPGFRAEFRRGKGGSKEYTTVASVYDTFLANALAIVSGHTTASGEASWSVKSNRYNLSSLNNRIGPDRDKKTGKYDHLSAIRFRAYYFIMRTDFIQGPIFTVLREMLEEYGGIRIYRNGFRVLPYGEQGSDWLGLDKLSGRRTRTLAPISNRSWIGFVEIDDPKDLQFKETSSREGLVENASYEQLCDFVARSLLAAVQKIDELRDQLGEKDPWHKRRRPQEASEQAEVLVSAVRKLGGTVDAENESARDREDAAQAIESGIRELAADAEDVLEELSLLRILATMGLTLAEFVHEIGPIGAAIELELGRIRDDPTGSRSVADAIRGITRHFRTLQSYTAYFNEMTSYNAARELANIDLEEVVTQFVSAMQNVLSRHGIEISTEHKSTLGAVTCPMHRSEWSSILLNFLTNSIKAISRVREPGRILISTEQKGDRAILEFSDNGDGIPRSDWERVFNAFFTTTAPASPFGMLADHGTGTGLGLKIVRDIVSSVNGTVSVISPVRHFSTCMRVEVPAQDDAE